MKSAFFGLSGLIAQAFKPKKVSQEPIPKPSVVFKYLICPDMSRPNAQAELFTMSVLFSHMTGVVKGFGIYGENGLLGLTEERYNKLRSEYQMHFRLIDDKDDIK